MNNNTNIFMSWITDEWSRKNKPEVWSIKYGKMRLWENVNGNKYYFRMRTWMSDKPR